MASTTDSELVEETGSSSNLAFNFSGISSKVHWQMSFNPCVGYILSGLFFFCCVNYATRWSLPMAVKQTARQNPQEVKWKWRNVLTSFIHSTITGIWAPLAFASQPSLGADMIHAYSTNAHALISVSIGYFIYDFCDMAIYHRKGSTYELLIHHSMVILCFGIAVSTRTYVAYAALSLVVEINSIFLHARQLLMIGGVSKSSRVYRANAIMNVATFVLFRILLLGWMTRWLTLNREAVPVLFFTVGSLGLATIVGMNIVLFYRILVGDYLSKKKSTADCYNEETSDNDIGNAAPSVGKSQTNSILHRRQPHLANDVNRIVRSLFEEQE